MLMAAKLCDSCKSATATVFCRADSAFLCVSCDSTIHAANKLASRHARVWLCEVCEHAPATVTCKADAAHLCSTCDRDIHSANPLARRHDRVPLTPFFDSSEDQHQSTADVASAEAAAKSAAMSKLFGDDYYDDADAEAASWLDSNANGKGDDGDGVNYLLPGEEGLDPYLDLDPKPDPSSDGLVPDPDHNHIISNEQHYSTLPATETGTGIGIGIGIGTNSHYSLSHIHASTQPASLSHSVSSSSLDYGVVPDATISSGVGEGASATITVRSGLGIESRLGLGLGEQDQIKMLGMDREARVLRYREKRKNRKFEKTIRYASRKAYAETRPRIKGRFAKRTPPDPAYGVVPSF